jgi:hypothetical protein
MKNEKLKMKENWLPMRQIPVATGVHSDYRAPRSQLFIFHFAFFILNSLLAFQP